MSVACDLTLASVWHLTQKVHDRRVEDFKFLQPALDCVLTASGKILSSLRNNGECLLRAGNGPISYMTNLNDDLYGAISPAIADELRSQEVQFPLNLKVRLNEQDLLTTNDALNVRFSIESWWQSYAKGVSTEPGTVPLRRRDRVSTNRL